MFTKNTSAGPGTPVEEYCQLSRTWYYLVGRWPIMSGTTLTIKIRPRIKSPLYTGDVGEIAVLLINLFLTNTYNTYPAVWSASAHFFFCL